MTNEERTERQTRRSLASVERINTLFQSEVLPEHYDKVSNGTTTIEECKQLLKDGAESNLTAEQIDRITELTGAKLQVVEDTKVDETKVDETKVETTAVVETKAEVTPEAELKSLLKAAAGGSLTDDQQKRVAELTIE